MKPSYTELTQRVIQLETENTRLSRGHGDLPNNPDLFRLVVAHAPAAIAVLDKDLRYLSFSNRYLEAYHLKAEDLLGHSHHEVFPDLPLRWKQEHLRCLQGERVGPLVDMLERQGGRREWVKRELAPWTRPDGRVGGIIIFNQIITRERDAAEALQESERLYRDLVESINDVIYALGPNGKLTYISPSIESIVGYTAEEIVGKHFLTFVDLRDRERIGAAFRERTSGVITPTEYRLTAKDGQACWVRSSTQPIYEDGLLRELRGVVTDIRREKAAQPEKRKLDEQLQPAQKMEALGTLAGGVAHDLNNILSGIVSYPDLLLMDLPVDSPMRRPIEGMKQSGMRAAAIVQDLLAMARRGVLASEVIDINALIETCLQSPEWLKHSAEQPDLHIRTRLAPDLLNMEGSAAHISSMALNLLRNSAEAIDGAGEIVLTTANIHLEETSPGLCRLPAGDYLVLRISDDGCGISEVDREHIFEPFYTRRKMGRSGTGLGMAVVWGTVVDHKGHIELESHEGQGTTVTVTLPATHHMVEAEAPGKDEMGTYQGEGQSVLVVDDQEAQRQIATQILTRLGYTSAAVESGESALTYLQTHSADLILLDMIMAPGMDGLETFQRIQARVPGQRVILVSGYAQKERVSKALELGAAVCLRKPYTVAGLGRAVREQVLKN